MARNKIHRQALHVRPYEFSASHNNVDTHSPDSLSVAPANASATACDIRADPVPALRATSQYFAQTASRSPDIAPRPQIHANEAAAPPPDRPPSRTASKRFIRARKSAVRIKYGRASTRSARGSIRTTAGAAGSAEKNSASRAGSNSATQFNSIMFVIFASLQLHRFTCGLRERRTPAIMIVRTPQSMAGEAGGAMKNIHG